MFGYVRPRRDLLTQDDFAAYHAAYCGLCRALGRQYGFHARFLVNYDMTFLYLLRAAVAEACPCKPCWCPARLCGRKRCVQDDAGFAPVAACTVILSYEKLCDNVRDKSLLRGLPDRLLCLLYRRAFRRAARALPAFAGLCAGQLSALHALEAASSPSVDATADAFARIVVGCAADLPDPALRRPMEQVLYHTGRFLYLADALDDLKSDCAQQAYNPLRFRFSVCDGALCAADLEYLTQIIDSSVNLAGAALALLPLRAYGGLLENILFLGLPTVFFAVKTGKFKARSSLRRNRNNKTDDTGETK